MTVNKLPSASTIRWTIWRKAKVVAAVHNGLLGLDEARERYRMSAEEFLNWEQLIAAHGLVHQEVSVMSSSVKEFGYANPRCKPAVLHLEIELDPSSSLDELTQAAKEFIRGRLARMAASAASKPRRGQR